MQQTLCINGGPENCRIFVSEGSLPELDDLIAQLHSNYAAKVYFLALRELRSRAAAEDVRGETLLRVVEALRNGKLDTLEALPGFVVGTARNVIHEYRRKQSRTTPMDDHDQPAPEREGVDHTVRRAMNLVLGQLKPRERELIRLYYFEELSKEEIGTRLGIDPERVRLVKSRALKSFREFYERVTRLGG